MWYNWVSFLYILIVNKIWGNTISPFQYLGQRTGISILGCVWSFSPFSFSFIIVIAVYFVMLEDQTKSLAHGRSAGSLRATSLAPSYHFLLLYRIQTKNPEAKVFWVIFNPSTVNTQSHLTLWKHSNAVESPGFKHRWPHLPFPLKNGSPQGWSLHWISNPSCQSWSHIHSSKSTQNGKVGFIYLCIYAYMKRKVHECEIEYREEVGVGKERD